MTDEQAENARVAYAYMAGIPAGRFELNTVRRVHGHVATDDRLFKDCGATGCVCGWLSATPYFHSKGMWYDTNPGEVKMTIEGYSTTDLWLMSTTLFGDQAPSVFNPGPSGISGKLEAMTRLRRVLLKGRRITLKRNKKLRAYEQSMLTGAL